jgi:hypothetical protein
MITAIVSPTARPIPRITAATMPDFAAGSCTCIIVCQCVMPRAKAPSLYWRGKSISDTSDMLIIVGSIIIANIIEPAMILSPGPPRLLRIAGTTNSKPQKPYTTDGIPAKS